MRSKAGRLLKRNGGKGDRGQQAWNERNLPHMIVKKIVVGINA